MFTPDSTLVTNTLDICNEFYKFYKNLYSKEPTDEAAQQFTLSQFRATLTPEQSTQLEKPLTRSELRAALFALPTGKSPGSDGLPAAFYRTFWDLLGEDLFNVITYGLSTDTLPASLYKAIVTLIPKKGDTRLVQNWRTNQSP